MRTFVFLLITIIISFLSPLRGEAALMWKAIAPNGGDQFEVKISPVDPNTLFSIAHFAIHRSDDAGSTWQPIYTTEMSRGSVLALIFDPDDANHILVSSTVGGVWESYDQGNSWGNCSNGLPLINDTDQYYPVVSLTFDSSGNIFAGLSKAKSETGPPAMIYRRGNSCDSWSPDATGINITATGLTQEVSTLLSVDSYDQLWAIVYGAGVYRYQDGEWWSTNGDLPAEALKSTFLQHDPSNSNHLLLSTEFNWIFETLDGGITWDPMVLPQALSTLNVLPLVYTIGIDPNNSNLIYVSAFDAKGSIESPIFHPQPSQTSGGNGYLSLNGGISWIVLPLPSFRVTFDPSETVTDFIYTRSRVWYFTNGGVYNLIKTNDGGLSFQLFNNGINNVLINSVWIYPSPANQTKLLFAAAEAGLFLLPDNSETWNYQKPVTNYLYSWSFANDYSNSNAIFYSTGNPAWTFNSQRGIYRISLDCFGQQDCSGSQVLENTGVWRLITTANKPETIYAASQEKGIMVSSDKGANWSEFNNGLTLPVSITDIVLDLNGDPLFASARANNGNVTANPPQPWRPSLDETGGVYYFDPGTSKWEQTSGLSAATLDLELDPFSQTTLFAATVKGIYKTNDNGRTWEVFLPDTMVYDLLLHPNKQGYMYAATNFGVVRSTDGGKQWQVISDGLLQQVVLSLDIDAATGILYAGTNGNSVYQLIPDSDPKASITIEPTSLDFGFVGVGLSNNSQISVKNQGEADLVISDITPAGPTFNVLGFSEPVTITPGSYIVLTVRFSPQSAGVVNSTISFSSNDPDNQEFEYTVKGEGQVAGGPIPDVKVNGEDGPLEIPYGELANISINLTVGDDFREEADYWLKLTSRDSITFWFVDGSGWVESETPLLAMIAPIVDFEEPMFMNIGSLLSGNANVYFAIDNNADGNFDGTWSDTVSFTVSDSPPMISVVPEELSFSDSAVGGPQKILYFAIANVGDQDLEVTAIHIDDNHFKLIDTPNFPVTIASLDSTILQVEFLPQQPGPYSGTLSIASDDPLSPLITLPMNGNGIESVSPVPHTKANGETGLVTILQGTALNITIGLIANDYWGQESEWWVEAKTPFGDFWLSNNGWQLSDTPLSAITAPVFDITSLSILQSSFLPQGEYTFTFNIDNILNNSYDEVWSDTVSVKIE